jgi:hypothetical protein
VRLAAWVIVAGLLCMAGPALGQDASSTHRGVVDRADLEPASVGGFRLRVYFSALSIDGQVLDLSEPRSIKLLAGRTEVRAPYALGTFGAAETDLAIVFVIQATTEFSDVIRVITEAADAGALEGLPEGRTQVAIVTYGEAVGAGKLVSLKAARTKLRQVAIEGAAAEPVLLDALDRALRLLKSAHTEPEGRPLRKLIAVVSDGRDRSNDRDRVIALGKRAAAAGVRIHAFAHAPNDVRRPLLLLGELSKRSFGTFRWLRKDATTVGSWQPRFEQLRDEIKQQYVLTYFLDEDLGGRMLRIATTGRTQLDSLNEIKAPAVGCNGEACDVGYCADGCTQVRLPKKRGVLGWIFTVIGIAVGAILVLGVIGFVLTKRQQAKNVLLAGGAPGQPVPPGSVPPGSVPPGARLPSQQLPSQPGAPVTGGYPSGASVTGMPAGRMTGGYPGQPAQPIAPPTSGPRLYVMAGPRAGETLGLRHGFTFGAAANNDFVADGFASSHHAQIGVDPQGNCWITDLGSTNGTFINGVRVTQKALDHGVTLRIGSTEIRFLAQ